MSIKELFQTHCIHIVTALLLCRITCGAGSLMVILVYYGVTIVEGSRETIYLLYVCPSSMPPHRPAVVVSLGRTSFLAESPNPRELQLSRHFLLKI
jgi:hypothetical protein